MEEGRAGARHERIVRKCRCRTDRGSSEGGGGSMSSKVESAAALAQNSKSTGSICAIIPFLFKKVGWASVGHAEDCAFLRSSFGEGGREEGGEGGERGKGRGREGREEGGRRGEGRGKRETACAL